MLAYREDAQALLIYEKLLNMELFLFFINEIFFLLINMSIFDYHDIIIMIITYYHDTLDCDAIGFNQ